MSERREPKPPRMGWHPPLGTRKPTANPKPPRYFWEQPGWDVFSPEFAQELLAEVLPVFDPGVKNNPPVPKIDINPDDL